MARTTGNASDLITFTRASTGTFLGSNGLLQTAAINTPRIEYDANGVAKGLLIEEARTNLVTYSEAFDNGIWSKPSGVSVAANTDVAPDGTTAADTVTSAGNQIEQTVSCSTSTTYTNSLYFKKTAGATYTPGMYLLFAGGTLIIYAVRLDTDTGIATAVSAGGFTTPAAFSVSDEGDYWRLSITGSSGNNTAVSLRLYSNLNAGGASGAGSQVIWGAQVEQGSFPTSYIPTSGATATRSADIASVSVSEFGYNQAQGSVVVEANYTDQAVSSLVRIVNGTNLYFVYNSSGAWRFQAKSAGTVVAQLTAPANNSNDTIAAAWSSNDFVIVDGSGIDADTSGALPDTSGAILYFSGHGGYFGNGHIKSINYYPLRLSDAKLQELTS
jgi:hypothetical protein